MFTCDHCGDRFITFRDYNHHDTTDCLRSQVDTLQTNLQKAEGFIALFLHGDIDEESYKDALNFIQRPTG